MFLKLSQTLFYKKKFSSYKKLCVFEFSDKRLNPDSVFLLTSEKWTLKSLCAFFIKEISVENLPQNVINTVSNIFFFI